MSLMDGENKQNNINMTQVGSPTSPFHVTANSWEENNRKLEESIRNEVPFEGKWQSYIINFRLIIPKELHRLFDAGGVITVSTEKHLLLFGNRHWSRINKMLAKEVGLSPVNNEIARHIYSHMHRFTKLNDDGSINIPLELVQYAGLKKEVAIIGLIYHAEIHDKASYLSTENPSNTASMLARFRKIRFN